MPEYYLCPVCSNLHDVSESKTPFKSVFCVQKHIELTKEPIIQFGNGVFFNLNQSIYNFLSKNKIKHKEIHFYTFGELVVADENTFSYLKSTKSWNKLANGTHHIANLHNPAIKIVLYNE